MDSTSNIISPEALSFNFFDDSTYLEQTYVKNTYSQIANAFDITRQDIWTGVKEYLDYLEPDTYMLDAGCGNGKNMIYRTDIKTIGIDSCKEFVDICKNKNLDVREGNITNLEFPDNTFDSVISIAVIHHISKYCERKKIITEIIRILKTGGTAFIQVWAISVLNDKNKKKFTLIDNTSSDYLVKWNMKYKRYYHLFSEEEAYDLVSGIPNIYVTITKDRDNYCILIQKLK